jgi:hypothetical protein
MVGMREMVAPGIVVVVAVVVAIVLYDRYVNGLMNLERCTAAIRHVAQIRTDGFHDLGHAISYALHHP